MVLQNGYGCKVVGFSNSWDCVWLDRDYEASATNALRDAVYIDMFVADPSIVCIDQHIVGYDEAHNRRLAAMQTKINPNIMRTGRTFTGDFYHKYPLGTVHFLIAMMAAEGVTVSLPHLDKIKTRRLASYALTAGDILLRADDALHTTLVNYVANAQDWWNWLVRLSGHAQPVVQMVSYITNSNSSCSLQTKSRTGSYFTREFGCSGNDGAFNDIADSNGNLLPTVVNYRNEICNIMDLPLDLPLSLTTHRGYATTTKYCGHGDNLDQRVSPRLFSYAFIYGLSSSRNNLSLTLDMR